MRYAILSDIHGNLEALGAVIEALKKEKIDLFLCLGDIVGYGADPHECVKVVKELTQNIVAGNHDYAACGRHTLSNFNPSAKQALLWTINELREEDKDFLAALTLSKDIDDLTIAHASLVDPGDWNYIIYLSDVEENFGRLGKDILFTGHSHIPAIFGSNEGAKDGNKIKVYPPDGFHAPRSVIKLDKGIRYIVNAGSVGQPRDGDPRACFVIYDTDKKEVEVLRVDYNIVSASKKILAAGLPEYLAYRILSGQ